MFKEFSVEIVHNSRSAVVLRMRTIRGFSNLTAAAISTAKQTIKDKRKIKKKTGRGQARARKQIKVTQGDTFKDCDIQFNL
jgi:hypothetical protein